MAQKPENRDETSKPSRGKGKASAVIEATATEGVAAPTPEAVIPEAAAVEAVPASDSTSTAPGTAETATETPREPAVEPAPVEAPAAEPTPAPMPVAAAPQPAQPSKLAPALIGLVAGAIGGIAAYQIMEFSRPKTQPGESPLVARLAALEQKVAAAKPGEAPAVPAGLVERLERLEGHVASTGKGADLLRDELGKLGAALKVEVGERKKALEGLAPPTQALGLVSKEAGAELEGLKSRLGSVEGLQPRLDTVAKDVQALVGQIKGLSARDTLAAAQARLAAVTLLDDAATKGRPLASGLDMLKGLGAEAGPLAALAPFATSGLPDAKKLLEELKALVPPPAAATPTNGASFFDRVKQGAFSLVEVRKTGDAAGGTEDAAVTRAMQALQRGEITTAAAEIAKLSGDAATRFAPWRAKIEARTKALDALGALRNEALAALAKAAQPAK